MLRIQLTRRWPASIEAELATRYNLRRNLTDQPLSVAALVEALQWADVVCPTVTDQLDAALFAAVPPATLRAALLANYGVGVNHIDLPAAAQLGLAVSNTPGVLTEATAELTIALMLALARRLGEGERLLRANRWEGWAPTQLLGQSLLGARLGIIGFGRIGAAVARRAELGFGMQVSYYSRSSPPAARLHGLQAQRVPDLESLLGTSDVLSLHCPSTAQTRGLLNQQRLARCRPGALLVNTARGDLIDEAALCAALAAGHLGGAGLDVHAQEPQVHAGLLARNDVVLLPHLGSATVATRQAMGRRVLHNIDAFASGQPLPDPVAA